MSSKNILITSREQESTMERSKDKSSETDKTLKLQSKEAVQRMQEKKCILLPPIKRRKVISKPGNSQGMYSQFKESIETIREEANGIRTSLNQIKSKCWNFSKRLCISKSTMKHRNNQSRLNAFLNSNNTSLLSPISSGRRNSNGTEAYRLRNFVVFPIEFKKKLGLYAQDNISKYSKIIVNSLDFQMSYINDELKVIFENFEYIKRKYILNRTIQKVFGLIDLYQGKKINTVIEETCGLVLEIPYYLLGVFYNKVTEFLGKAPLNLDHLNNQKVKDEEMCFFDNCKIMLKAFSFLNACREMYQTLFPEVAGKELLISYGNFNITRGYLERIRYNINSLIEITDAQMRNSLKDKKAIEQFEEDIGNRAKKNSRKKGDDCIKKISNVLTLPSLEEVKINRINSVLDVTRSRNSKEKKVKRKEICKNNSLIRSPLIKSLFKYFNAELQERILALKSHQKKSSLG